MKQHNPWLYRIVGVIVVDGTGTSVDGTGEVVLTAEVWEETSAEGLVEVASVNSRWMKM